MTQPTTTTKFLVDSVKIALPNVLSFGFLHLSVMLISPKSVLYNMVQNHGSIPNVKRWHTLFTNALVHANILHLGYNFLAFSCCSMYLLPHLKSKLDKQDSELESQSKSHWKRNIIKSYSKFYKIYFIGTLISSLGVVLETKWRKNHLKKELISDNIYTNDEISKYMATYDMYNDDVFGVVHLEQ